MRKALLLFLFLLPSAFAIGNYTAEGGNVTGIDMNGTDFTINWEGFYGQVVISWYKEYNLALTGNNVSLFDLRAESRPSRCVRWKYAVIAVNDTTVYPPLHPGNLTVLDNAMMVWNNGTATFKNFSSFELSYGVFTNVSSTYTLSSDGTPRFLEGYLQDSRGNFVFTVPMLDNQLDWNGTFSDYQVMLPTRNPNLVNYTMWVDFICLRYENKDKKHDIEIHPIPDQYGTINETKTVGIEVEDTGDHNEHSVLVRITNCPSGWSCSSELIPVINVKDTVTVDLGITPDSTGTYLLNVRAKNDFAQADGEFYFIVEVECVSDEECPSGELCVEGICEKPEVPECETDEDCPDTQYCDEGVCKNVPCDCGEVYNHTCHPYECCEDTDCAECEYMCIAHECVQKELGILLVSGERAEGEAGTFQVVDNRLAPVYYANIYTESMSTYTGEEGIGTILFPYTGIISASKECYLPASVKFDILRKGFILIDEEVLSREEVQLRLVDSREKPLSGAEVSIDGSEYTTNGDGYASVIFDEEGTYAISAQKTGYIISPATVEAYEYLVLVEEVCRLPAFLKLYEVKRPDFWMLWALLILLAIGNFAVAYRDRLMKPVWVLPYALAPIILALPSTWVFTACFMVNIGFLELLALFAYDYKKRSRKGRRVKKARVAKE